MNFKLDFFIFGAITGYVGFVRLNKNEKATYLDVIFDEVIRDVLFLAFLT